MGFSFINQHEPTILGIPNVGNPHRIPWIQQHRLQLALRMVGDHGAAPQDLPDRCPGVAARVLCPAARRWSWETSRGWCKQQRWGVTSNQDLGFRLQDQIWKKTHEKTKYQLHVDSRTLSHTLAKLGEFSWQMVWFKKVMDL